MEMTHIMSDPSSETRWLLNKDDDDDGVTSCRERIRTYLTPFLLGSVFYYITLANVCQFYSGQHQMILTQANAK